MSPNEQVINEIFINLGRSIVPSLANTRNTFSYAWCHIITSRQERLDYLVWWSRKESVVHSTGTALVFHHVSQNIFCVIVSIECRPRDMY